VFIQISLFNDADYENHPRIILNGKRRKQREGDSEKERSRLKEKEMEHWRYLKMPWVKNVHWEMNS
jgi:hypothetical protein